MRIEKGEGQQEFDIDSLVGIVMRYFEGLEWLIDESDNPAYHMWDKLFRCGWPELLAKKVQDGFENKYLPLAISDKEDMSPKEAAKIVWECGDDIKKLTDALKSLHNTYGTTKLGRVKHYRLPKEKYHWGSMFSYVQVVDKKGELEIESNFFGQFKDQADRALDMYPGLDISTGHILGCAYNLEFAKGMMFREVGSDYWISGPKRFFSGDPDNWNLDTVLNHIFLTDSHELKHLGYVEDERNWRKIGAVFMEMLSRWYVQKFDMGLGDKVPFDASNLTKIDLLLRQNTDKPLTYKEIVMTIAKDIEILALGKGKVANNMRKNGFYEGQSYIEGQIFPGISRPSDYPTLYDIPIKEGILGEEIEHWLMNVKTDNIFGVKNQKKWFKNYFEDQMTMEETLAEVGSILDYEHLFALWDEMNIADPGLLDEFRGNARAKLNGYAKLTADAKHVFSTYEDPRDIEIALNKVGQTYKPVMNYIEEVGKVLSRVVKDLGYNQVSALSAYQDWDSMKSDIENRNLNPADFYWPQNKARNFNNQRYRIHIPEVLNFFDKMGSPQERNYGFAHELISNCETMDELLALSRSVNFSTPEPKM